MVLIAKVLALMVLIGFGPGARAADVPEYQVKAAMLYNFALFVRWPAQLFPATNSPLVICVLGKDPFGPLLEREVQGLTVQQHPIQVRRCAKAAEARDCHIVFISRSEQSRLNDIIAGFTGVPVLTVSDLDEFATRDGIIGLVPKVTRIGLQVNLAAATRARLKIDSRLLSLAEIVRREPEEGK